MLSGVKKKKKKSEIWEQYEQIWPYFSETSSQVAKEGHYSHGYLGYGKNKAELTVHWEPEMLLSLLWATSFIQNQMLYIWWMSDSAKQYKSLLFLPG